MPNPSPDKLTARALSEALAVRYAPPAWAYLPQVRNGTGFLRTTRTADAIAMSLWPSRGLELHGFEIKVHRGDWIKELREPAKAEEIASRCDRWWVVAGDEAIVQAGELPPTWGLLVLKGGRLVAKVEAPKLDAVPADRAFLAAVLRRVQESTVPVEEVDKRVEEGVTKEREAWEHGLRFAREQSEELVRKVAGFEKALGIQIAHGWHHSEATGAAVRYVLDHGPEKVRRDMEALRGAALRIAEAVGKELEGAEKGTSMGTADSQARGGYTK